MPTFEEQAQSIVSVAAQIARAQNTADAIVLENSSASLILNGYDVDGNPYYTLTLEVPIQTYIEIEQSRPGLEKVILHRIRPIIRRYPGSSISEVIITPELSSASGPHALSEELDETQELPSFWQTGAFRLFISHARSNKASAHSLKDALGKYPIAAFVAHDDIEPTKEWQAEIERALRTADALAAIVSPDFIESQWCDQEVGFALGRGKVVVPLCKDGCVPYGFLGKYQGFNAKGLLAPEVAEQLFQMLFSHELTSDRMADALVEQVATAFSFQSAKDGMQLLERVPKLSKTQVARLVQSITDNDQVSRAIGVPERIRALVARIG